MGPSIHKVDGTDCAGDAVRVASEMPDARRRVEEDFEVPASKKGPLNLYKTNRLQMQLMFALIVRLQTPMA